VLRTDEEQTNWIAARRTSCVIGSSCRSHFAGAVLTFFVAGLFYPLRFKARREHGSAQHPIGDWPLHPICQQKLAHKPPALTRKRQDPGG